MPQLPFVMIYATLRLLGIGAFNVGLGVGLHLMFNVGVGVICICVALYGYVNY